MEEDGEDQLDQHGEKLIIRKRSWRQGRPTYSKMEEGELDWSHLVWKLPFRSLKKEVTRRRRRRSKQLLDELNCKLGHWDLREEEAAGTLWRTRLDSRYGPVARLRNDGRVRACKSERA